MNLLGELCSTSRCRERVAFVCLQAPTHTQRSAPSPGSGLHAQPAAVRRQSAESICRDLRFRALSASVRAISNTQPPLNSPRSRW